MAVSSTWASWKTRSAIMLGIGHIRGLFSWSLKSSKPRLSICTNTTPVAASSPTGTTPQLPYPAASYAKALFGLVTPMTEAATLVGASRYLRWEARLQGGVHQPVLLEYLDNIRYYIPGTSRFEETPGGLI